MDQAETVRIDARFCGPPGSGNGGFVAGTLARRVGVAAEVTLRRPAPLEQPLALRSRSAEAGGREWLLCHGQAEVAVARAARPAPGVPAAPGLAEAQRASAGARNDAHPYPHCFVCGPARGPGDGLRILAGPLEGGGVAAPWTPDASLADASGRVETVFLWAALDCPGGFAAMGDAPRPMLLGRITAEIAARPRVGEGCVAFGWPIARDGRKHEVGTALVDEAGRVVAHSRQLWIEPR